MSTSSSHSHGRDGPKTVSTRVEEETLARVETRCEHAGESKAAFLRRLIHMYVASVEGRLRCEHCGEAVRLEE
jgi:predicted DNA-binding protein